MSTINTVQYFRFWCQKVIPLVYDDSLSYYEVLCKVKEKLNEVITQINNIPEYIQELISDEKLEELISGIMDELRENIAEINEHTSSTATGDRTTGQLLWWKDMLYKVVRPINIGDAYIDYSDNPNITKVTVEELIDALNTRCDSLDERITPMESSLEQALLDIATNSENIQANTEAIGELNTSLEAVSDKVSNLEVVNVKDYGAKGDGSTDDTVSIASAVAKVNSDGGILYFPNGRYVVTDTFTITRYGVHIKGCNAHGTYILQQSDKGVFIFGNGSLPTLTGIKVEDIGFVNQSNSTTNTIALHFNFCVNCLVNNVVVANFDKGIKFTNTGNSFITNTGVTSIRSGAIAFYVGNRSVSISLNNVYAGFSGGAVDNGIGLYDAEGNIADINVNYLDVGAGGYGVYIDGQNSPADFPPADIRLHEIVADGSRLAGIYIQNINGQGNVTIEGGWINPEKTGSTKCIDIKNANNINIRGTVLQQLADESPVVVGIALDTVVAIDIENVQFINLKSAIAAYGCDRVTFNGNKITLYTGKSSSDYAVNLSNCYNMIVSGNGVYGSYARGIYQGGTSDYLIVTSNIVRGPADQIHTSATNNEIANNIT